MRRISARSFGSIFGSGPAGVVAIHYTVTPTVSAPALAKSRPNALSGFVEGHRPIHNRNTVESLDRAEDLIQN